MRYVVQPRDCTTPTIDGRRSQTAPRTNGPGRHLEYPRLHVQQSQQHVHLWPSERMTEYKAPPGVCGDCRFRTECSPTGKRRGLRRSFDRGLLEDVQRWLDTDEGRARYKQRQVYSRNAIRHRETAPWSEASAVAGQMESPDPGLAHSGGDEHEEASEEQRDQRRWGAIPASA